jgi:hypothetical protein
VGVAVPFVHAVEHGVGLMHHPGRGFGDHFQIRVGDHHRQFDDAVVVGVEAGHFHVQPDQRVFILCHEHS